MRRVHEQRQKPGKKKLVMVDEADGEESEEGEGGSEESEGEDEEGEGEAQDKEEQQPRRTARKRQTTGPDPKKQKVMMYTNMVH